MILDAYIQANDWNVVFGETSRNYYVPSLNNKLASGGVVSIQASDSGSILEIHSESRLGWGDLKSTERITKYMMSY